MSMKYIAKNFAIAFVVSFAAIGGGYVGKRIGERILYGKNYA